MTRTLAASAAFALVLAASARADSFSDALAAGFPENGFEASHRAASAAAQIRRGEDLSSKTAATAACLRDVDCRTFFVVAHRTGGFGAPENSVEGVRRAVEFGIPLIETDIRFTKDGTWVMMHDPKINRTTNMKGNVSEKTWAELQAARLSDGESIPRFQDEYAASRGRAILVLDLKVNAVDLVADWLDKYGSFDDVIFFASDVQTLASCSRAHERYPRMMVMARVEDGLSWEDARVAYGGRFPLIVHSNFPPSELSRELRLVGSKLYTTWIPHDRVPIWREDIAGMLIDRGSQLVDTDFPRLLTLFAKNHPGTPEGAIAPVQTQTADAR